MFTYQNMNVHVEVEGEGNGILLLHGWGANHFMMKFLQDHFKAGYQVMNLDLPGFGQSDLPSSVWTILDYVKLLEALVKEYKMHDVTIVAHSFGARIALRYALVHPVHKMVLTGAAGIKNRHGILYYLRVYSFKILRAMHINVQMGSEDYQKANPIMRGVLVASLKDDIRPDLDKINCETLLVWGERDQATPLWMGESMEKELVNATLIVLEKGDHFAYFYQSFRFTQIVEAFLNG